MSNETNKAPGFNITMNASEEKVAGLLCSGFEGGVGYWCRVMDARFGDDVKAYLFETPTIFEYPLSEGGAVICRLLEEETDEKYNPLVLDRKAVERGLTLMSVKYPRHWANFLTENYDSETGDVFIQLCLLGTVVYG